MHSLVVLLAYRTPAVELSLIYILPYFRVAQKPKVLGTLEDVHFLVPYSVVRYHVNFKSDTLMFRGAPSTLDVYTATVIILKKVSYLKLAHI